ncbi:HAMP domain-containing sensor histidine kinase [Paenibacillus macerans]|uniref:HAMP domain-containing sensor histidine kinase n=1 Tax=Paenibacillus macerans TaxID=44252 RepID=UPI002DBC8EDB|nr:HAMP domain-containing sensor histidine kinase [Paenibacillus macerans]MEC0333940.1 HAMP domain-containing sensor histidine kinase [Paenibacillus macerans]
MTLLLLFLMGSALILFVTKARSPAAYWMACVLFGWFLSMSGLVLFLAKYGGFYFKVNRVLFFNEAIRNVLLHSPLQIGDISRMITIGRSVFFFGLLSLAITLYLNKPFKKLWKYIALNSLLPLLNIVFYDPVVYKWILNTVERKYTFVIGWVTRGWIVLSALVAFFLILRRYRNITIPWIKKQISFILLGLLGLNGFYFYLGFMGPLQVTDIRTYYVLYSDFSNFNPPLNLFEWYFSILFTGGVSLVSLLAIWRYTRVEKNMGKLDLRLERKLKTADMGTKIFTHALKNQLLTLQVLNKKMEQTARLREERSGADSQLLQQLEQSGAIIHHTLDRLDQLYKSFKTNFLQLRPVSAGAFMEELLGSLKGIPDSIRIEYEAPEDDPKILADAGHLSDALHNVIVNAVEAIDSQQGGRVRIEAYSEEKWLVIRMIDNGSGIEPEQLGEIFDPFYTSKNTNRNWGLGLSYTKQVVSGHFGYIDVTSAPGAGTTFQIFLPIYITD